MKKRISRISVLLITCSMLFGLAPAGALAASTYRITARTVTEDGIVKDTGTVSVESGKSKSFVFQPNTGYVLTDVLLDGTSVGDKVTNEILYTLENVTADHTLEVRFSKTIPEEAKAAVEQKAQEVTAEIQSLRLITDEEKSGAVAYVEQARSNAAKVIDGALTASEVRRNQEQALTDMETQLTTLKNMEEKREAEEAAAKAEAEKEEAAVKAKVGKKKAIQKAKTELAKQKITLKKGTVSVKRQTVKLSWKGKTSVTGYRVYRKVKGGKYQAVKTLKAPKTAKQLIWTGKIPEKGKTCYYRVRAYRSVSGTKVWSPYSNTVSVKIS